MALPLVVRELAAGHRVQVAVLFEFQFASSTQRFWDGARDLVAGGHTWQASGDIISVSGIMNTASTRAQPVTFKLAKATANMMEVAQNAADEATGRPCSIYLQFLSSAYTPLEDRIAIWAGTMDQVTSSYGVRENSMTMTAETLFVDRVRAPYGFMTDTDQQARWPGDLGFEFMPKLLYKTVNWLRA